MTAHLREHWRTWAMAGLLALCGLARCSVPQMVVMAPIVDLEPVHQVAAVESKGRKG